MWNHNSYKCQDSTTATEIDVIKVAIIKIISLSLFTFSPRDLAESSESESILILFE